jgi:hypothetical protein
MLRITVNSRCDLNDITKFLERHNVSAKIDEAMMSIIAQTDLCALFGEHNICSEVNFKNMTISVLIE